MQYTNRFKAENGARKILVADNDEDILVALERILEDDGYVTTTALSGAEVCLLLSGCRFDLLVLDDYLSDNDSVQLLCECRRAGLALPPTIVTYHRVPSFEDQARLRALGVKALVNKHAHSELIGIVQGLLSPYDAPHPDELESMK